MNKLNKLFESRSENDIELHVKEVEKRGTRIEIRNKEYKPSDFDTRKIEINKELKNKEYNDLEDMVFRMELTYDEDVDIKDDKNIAGSATGYTLPPRKYEITDFNFMVTYLHPIEVKVNITIDDTRLKLNLTTNKTIKFIEKSFIYTILCFIHSHSGPLGDIEGFNHLSPGTCKSNKPNNISGTDKIHVKYGCINGTILNGIGEHIIYRFALDKPPGHKI